MTLRTAASAAAMALALGLSGQALAQTSGGNQPPASTQSAPKTQAPVAGQITTQNAGTILADRDLIGETVYAADKSKIGSISDLILSSDGKSVQGFVIGVGGFLGIGEKNVALEMDKLKMTHNPDGSVMLMMNASREELTNAPAFKSRREQ